ncbi:MAG: lipoprotein [Methylobacteriaceae bacterium]|nr:lipoprotein [Rhodoblastus sp.]MCC0004961.1 lipoprotein [Methylobacteriaceae bacterium]
MSSRTRILVGIVAALVLTGCGRRGPLEPPPGSPPQARASQQVEPKTQAPGAPGGLFRNTGPKAEEPESTTASPPKRSSTFVLDPLL